LKHYDPFLTSFLTSLLKMKSSSSLQKAIEVISHLLDAPGNTSYTSRIAAENGRDRREYFYIVKKLKKLGIIHEAGVRSSSKLLKLNESVKKEIKKILEGVKTYSSSNSPVVSRDSSVSKYPDSYRAHRHVSYFVHNLSDFRFKQLRGKWTHNHSRVTITEFFDNDYFDIVFTRHKCIIYSPVVFGSLHEYSKLRSIISIRVGKLVSYLERKYIVELQPEEEKLFFDKYEIACQDPLNKYAAEMMKEQGYDTVTYPDWQMDASLGDPEIDLNQGWFQVSREGYGPELYDRMLHLPETFNTFYQEYKDTTAVLLQKIETIPQQTSPVQEKSWEKLLMVLENLVTYTMEKLATKEDVETIREDINKYSRRIVRTGSIQDRILEQLEQADYTAYELVDILNLDYSVVFYHLKKLLQKNKIISHKDENQIGRGRKKLIYKLR